MKRAKPIAHIRARCPECDEESTAQLILDDEGYLDSIISYSHNCPCSWEPIEELILAAEFDEKDIEYP